MIGPSELLQTKTPAVRTNQGSSQSCRCWEEPPEERRPLNLRHRDEMKSHWGHLCLCASELRGSPAVVSGEAGRDVVGRVGGRGFLAVRQHEDDKLGCHSPPFFLISSDVPGWTSVSPLSFWRAAPDCPFQHAISCFGGRSRGVLARWRLPPCRLAAVMASSARERRCFNTRQQISSEVECEVPT